MTRGNAYINEYRKSAISTASPLQLIVMLYDGALRFMAAGKAAMLEGDRFKQNDYLQRAQRIVAELISCLDMEKGQHISQNLLGLYTFVYNRLVEANVEDKPDYIDHCDHVMRELRSSWATIEAQMRSSQQSGDPTDAVVEGGQRAA